MTGKRNITTVHPSTGTTTTPYEQARTFLIEHDWRGIAGWDQHGAYATRKTKADTAIDLYAKNGRTLLLCAQRGGGFEVYYPGQRMKIVDCLAEMLKWGDEGRFPTDPKADYKGPG